MDKLRPVHFSSLAPGESFMHLEPVAVAVLVAVRWALGAWDVAAHVFTIPLALLVSCLTVSWDALAWILRSSSLSWSSEGGGAEANGGNDEGLEEMHCQCLVVFCKRE
ncbi:hypothetical protein BT63DRAFT_70044 [Microthyrium microscopicum]|uniref:Uncharacterized protein n=1 Tax=Microthyrium microscopicum TaxID=703497 RepID=A0A6A6U140_9PEZI|nr:hypothetical protein BT63DRAFT_70044 [Microthyrium microscopicum]